MPYDTAMLRRTGPLLFIIICLITGISGSIVAEDIITVQLKVFPKNYTLHIDGERAPAELFDIPEQRRGVRLAPGRHLFRFSAEGYKELLEFVSCTAHNMLYEAKLEKKKSPFTLLHRVTTGTQPKSVEFTPDGKYMVTALLEGRGIQVFSVPDCTEMEIDPVPKEYADARGFVELAFVERKKEMWVTQMTTHRVHIYDYTDFHYKGSIDLQGNWSKAICISPDETKAYVSNWISGDISVIDVEKRKFLYTIPTGGTPRGMAFSKDGEYLYLCRFDNGSIQKINVTSRSVEKTLDWGWGAKRHIVLDTEHNIFYASDMARHSIFIIDGETDTLLKELYIDYNPNTIALSSDSRYLFISIRGKNNPQSYLIKGYEFGKIYVVDTGKREIIQWLWGMNQPTGLAVSPDDSYLAYSNFLDYTVELYTLHFTEN